jgi:hypothetical protein
VLSKVLHACRPPAMIASSRGELVAPLKRLPTALAL